MRGRWLERCRQEAVWLAAGLGIVVLAGIPAILYPFGRDQAMFAYVADAWLHGDLPYRDAWDIKPPGIFAVYALAFSAFGRGVWAPRIADLVATLIAAFALYVIARRQGGCLQAVIAVALFGLAYFTLSYWDTAQAESFAAVFTVLFVYALLRARDDGGASWWAAAGLCLGCLVLLKTTFAAFVVLAVPAGWSTIWQRRRIGLGLRAFAVACAVPTALMLGYFAHHDALAYLGELITAQMGYAQGHGGDHLRWAAPDWALLAQEPTLLLCVLCAGLSVLAGRARRGPDHWIVVAWLGASLLLFVVQQRFPPYHAVPILPPLALLASAPLASAAGSLVRARGRARRVLAVAGVALVLIGAAAPVYPRYRLAYSVLSGRLSRHEYWANFEGMYNYSYGECVLVADLIRARTRPAEPILVYAFEPAIYFLAERRSPTRHLSTAPIFGETQIPKEMRQRWLAEQLRDIADRPPHYLVMVLPAVHDQSPEHVTLGGHRFRRETTIEKFLVYRLSE